MKNKALPTILIFMIAALAACGPTPVPTMNPADAQGTAVAAAWTVVAMTEAAIPTATPNPPTEMPSPTLQPTWTPIPPTTSVDTLATQPVFSVPTNPPAAVAGGPTADACQGAISAHAEGHKVKTRIINLTDGSVVLSLYLAKTIFGECGYYSFNIGPRGSTSADLLEGNYWAGAFVTGKKDVKSFGVNLVVKGQSMTIKITEKEIK